METIISRSISDRTSRRSHFDETDGSVGVLVGQEAIDLPLQAEVGAVVSEQGDAVGDPILAHQVFRAHQPVPQSMEESVVQDLRRCTEIRGKRAHRLLVRLEEKSVLATEVLKDGSLGDPEFIGHVADPGVLKPVLSKVAHCGVDNLRALHR